MQGDLRQIQARIKGLQSSLHTTKAMKMEAAAKLKHSQGQSLAGQVYQNALRLLLEDIIQYADSDELYVLREHAEEEVEVRPDLVIVFGSNRGLAGNFNQLIHNEMKRCHNQAKKEGRQIIFAPLGKKAAHFAEKNGYSMIQIDSFSDLPKLEEALNLSNSLLEIWKSEKYRSISILLMRFISSSQQDLLIEKYLPLTWDQETIGWHKSKGNSYSKASVEEKRKLDEMVFDPDLHTIIKDLLEQYLVGLIYQLQIESKASEHLFRMRAMTKATDNAEEMLDEMRILFNRERQRNITQEIIEILNGAQAMESLDDSL